MYDRFLTSVNIQDYIIFLIAYWFLYKQTLYLSLKYSITLKEQIFKKYM